VRIISGTYRGKKLHPPRNFKARPTTDFAKEGLFNILLNQFEMEELDILDLFAGTGSITYEFASRGARSIVAVEIEPAHFKFIQSTCRDMELDQVTVIRGDAIKYLKNPVQSFDIIFADPPYDHPLLEELPEMVFTQDILTDEGVFILEHSVKHTFSAHPRFFHHRNYGSVNFTFFR
jgi:16S rRNA (guanine(966)-N(2))-methyltransferase RsmD